MHEFSIAISIIDAVEFEAKKVDANTITNLTLDIGTMSGIEFYALDTAMEMEIKNTILDKTKIIVNKVQATAKCIDCSHNFEIFHITDACPKCNGFFHEIIRGKELKIKSIVVE